MLLPLRFPRVHTSLFLVAIDSNISCCCEALQCLASNLTWLSGKGCEICPHPCPRLTSQPLVGCRQQVVTSSCLQGYLRLAWGGRAKYSHSSSCEMTVARGVQPTSSAAKSYVLTDTWGRIHGVEVSRYPESKAKSRNKISCFRRHDDGLGLQGIVVCYFTLGSLYPRTAL